MAPPPLFTIGYEDQPQDAVIAKLKAAHIAEVIDVRAVAASRRAGFSKTVLANSLRDAGVAYLHLRDLGTPKPGRDAARKGDSAAMRSIFEAHLETPAAGLAFERLVEASGARPVALLCYEADAAGCHRRVLSERIHARTGAEVIDL